MLDFNMYLKVKYMVFMRSQIFNHLQIQVVRVDDRVKDVLYIQRGCLPGCQNSVEHNVRDYGKGTMECCVGDLCNHAIKAGGRTIIALLLGVITIMIIIL